MFKPNQNLNKGMMTLSNASSVIYLKPDVDKNILAMNPSESSSIFKSLDGTTDSGSIEDSKSSKDKSKRSHN